MYEFAPFKKSDILKFNSSIQVPWELLEKEEYKKRNGIENFDCLYANKF